jgi:nucleotide-binding universal stress UspA family protein
MTVTHIAGYDGSPAAVAAIRFAETLAGQAGGEAVAATVYEPVPHLHARGGSRPADEELNQHIVREAHQVQEQLDVAGVRKRVVPGRSAAHGLHVLAEREGAAMLVVGTTHRGALGRLVPGSVGERLLHGSPCPVAVVPPEWDGAPLRTIAVAYDGGAESRAALHAAEELAARADARLLVLTVYDPASVYVTGSAGMYAAGFGDEVRQALADAARRAAGAVRADVPVDWRLLQGPPSRTLHDAVSEEADLLVMGSRAYGPVRTVLLGSTARQIVDHAPCPVVVVPRSAATAPEAEDGELAAASPP